MAPVTALQLAALINGLPKNTDLTYVDSGAGRLIQVKHVALPEGPVTFVRYDPTRETAAQADNSTISANMLWRVANAIQEGIPFQIDRIVGASYNSRAVLEAMLAHTPPFYVCYPGRIDRRGIITEIVEGHKFLVYLPNDPHQLGTVEVRDTDIVVAEVQPGSAIYVSGDGVASELGLATPISEAELREHARRQVALLYIAEQLRLRVWIASNDRNVQFEGAPVAVRDSVYSAFGEIPLFSAFPAEKPRGQLIDCMWVRKENGEVPFVFEVEHSTGISSGVHRMGIFLRSLPGVRTRAVIVAPDSLREKALLEIEAVKTTYPEREFFYLPYTALDLLLSLAQSGRLRYGVSPEIILSFVEK